MNIVLDNFKANLNKATYLKDPNSSDLGKKIVATSAKLIISLGIEQFTFKKLSIAINTTEASVYRYFKDKKQLLVYLLNLYWAHLDYQLVLASANMEKGEPKITKLIETLVQPSNTICSSNLDFNSLRLLATEEGSKAYFTKTVETNNKLGYFAVYKSLVQRLADAIHETNPQYAYFTTLASTCLEGIMHQQFFMQHIPNLAQNTNNSNDLVQCFVQLILNTIQNEQK